MKLSIIIPLYNEENNIIEVLKNLLKTDYTETICSYEILVIDDASKDNSFNVVSEFIKDKDNIKIYKQEKNQGKGAAVRKGFSLATGDLLFVQDADLELNPIDIPPMIRAYKMTNVEFVNGSRYLPGVARPLSSYKRYLGNKFFTLLTSMITNVKITDMACGYKLIHKNLLDKINLKENRFGFEAEVMIKAVKIKKNNMTEVPVHYFPRNNGEGKKFRNKDAFKILWTIFKYGILNCK